MNDTMRVKRPFTCLKTCRLTISLGIALLAVATPQQVSAIDTWTKGTKQVLIIPVSFSDFGGPSDVPGPGGYLSGWGKMVDGTTTAAISNSFDQMSYGQCQLQFTLLPEINLGVSYTDYNAMYGSSGSSKFTLWNEPGSFADAVRDQARLVGLGTGTPAVYDTDNYDLDIIACGFIPGQGVAASGLNYQKGVFARNYNALSHELCHNFGLQHANGISRATLYSPLKSGSFFTDAYGDVFDLMGWKDTSLIPMPADRDPNTYWKHQLGWLTDPYINTPVASGTYRIHAFDQGTLTPGNKYALRVQRDANFTYWFDYRQAITGLDSTWSDGGLHVRFGGESIPASQGHTLLIDTTPGSRGPQGEDYSTMRDAPLQLGRTYTDAEADLHVTPINKGGTVPESLDVVVNFGPFPGNTAPTVSISPPSIALTAGVPQLFTATASDPDSDPLAYYWEFDDDDAPGGTSFGGTNPDSTLATQGSHTWATNGTYFVRCTVTDMKGHTATASSEVTITGGAAGPLTISGVVRDEFGDPLAGAIVNNFKATAPIVYYGNPTFVGSSITAPDGRYIIPVPNGAGTYNLTAMHQGYTFTCSTPGGGINVAASNVSNVNFTRVRTNRTVSGSIVVAGVAYDPGVYGAFSVSDGIQTVAATFGSWQMTMADGTLAEFEPLPPPGYTVLNYFPNPYMVVDDYNRLHFDVKIPGMMPEMGFGTSGATSDDSVGTVQIPVTMTLPGSLTSWPGGQSVLCWVDESSTAEYGVDYEMSGGLKNFPGGVVPATQFIPLKIIQDGLPKNKTVVVRLGPATSVTNMGLLTTYTYTINNPSSSVSNWSAFE